jgi:hypothetical protein
MEPSPCAESTAHARRVLQAAVGVASVVSLVLLLTGCGGMTTAAPPLTVCGQTISRLPAGAVLQDVSRGGTVTQGSAGGYIYLRVSESCDNGVTVRWEPTTSAQKIGVAKAADGRLAAGRRASAPPNGFHRPPLPSRRGSLGAGESRPPARTKL